MTFTDQIGRYSLIYFGKRESDREDTARILLESIGGGPLGFIQFYKDNQVLQNNSALEHLTPKRIFLKMHEHQLARVVDMLRNEKPIQVHYRNPTWAFIYTGVGEPVGEEEKEVVS